jgi:acyl-CoA dehydrogenase
MDFDDTPEEAAFRAAAREWLTANAKPVAEGHRTSPWGKHEGDHVRACKAWQGQLYKGGWAGITWPTEYGGRAVSAIQAAIFNQEQARFDVSTGIFAVGIGMVGPTLIAHGTPEQKERYLGPLLRGEEVWCQLFSEPGAGSDLAGLSTRAERDGDEWVINGQKVWTSGAHFSDFGALLARSDPGARKHHGITYFLLDMKTPGVEVRPLRQITGAAHFNEVFLTDVRIPADQIVGEPHGGWGPALTTMANERNLIGSGAGLVFDELATFARSRGRTSDPVFRQRLAAAYTRFQVMRYVGFRTQTALSQGRPPGPESSILKLMFSQNQAVLGDLIMALKGDTVSDGFWETHFLNQWGSRIGGGTDQIQRNVIGERVLGLPTEPRGDKEMPFNELAKS